MKRGQHTDPDKKAEARQMILFGATAAEAARALGIGPRTTERIRREIREEARRGKLGYKPVLPGFVLRETSAELDAGGAVKRTFVRQVREPGEEFQPIGGHVVKGESAFIDAEGRVIAKWVKTREGERSVEDTVAIVQKAFEAWAPAAPAIIVPAECNDEMLTVYPLCDWHLGLFAWGRETAGPDWDLTIARRVLLGAVRDVIEQSPRSRTAVVLGLGDLLHADNASNQTERSKHVLDVDTRYGKCLETLCDILAETVDAVAGKHADVEVAFKPGNHDPVSTSAITQALRMYFRQSAHVAVETSPDPFYWKRFGVNLIGGVHGDKAKIPQLPMIMANRRKLDWAETSTRHMHSGHIHHDTVREIDGVHVFSHRAPVAQDAFHAAHGFLSGRSMKSFAYHAEKGAKGHTEIEIK
jgi:transposase-like protein